MIKTDWKPVMTDTGIGCKVCGSPVMIARNTLKYVKWQEDYCSRGCADKGLLKQGENKPVD